MTEPLPIELVPHPCGVTSAAHSLARLVAAQGPTWTASVDGLTWISTDATDEYGRWVAVDGNAYPTAPAGEVHPFGWLGGPVVMAGSDGGMRMRLELPALTDGTELRDVVEALTLLGILPKAPA